MLAYAVVRTVELVGEAAAQVSVETREQFPEIAWKNIVGIRNIVIHRYAEVNYDIIWRVVNRNFPELVEQLAEILAPPSSEQ
jgi:uncharacterized protein with HEPN domain